MSPTQDGSLDRLARRIEMNINRNKAFLSKLDGESTQNEPATDETEIMVVDATDDTESGE